MEPPPTVGAVTVTPAEPPTAHSELYSPLPESGHIRILIVEGAENLTDPIVCSLQTVDFHIVEYTALSYSWGMNETGDATENRAITINGRAKAVTQNLFEGLRRIRSHKGALRIWVDAVCINQKNIPERNAQVAQMADVYRRATTVAVWLGEGRSEAEDLVMQNFLESLRHHQKEKGRYGVYRASCIIRCFLKDLLRDCACSENIEDQTREHDSAGSLRRSVDDWNMEDSVILPALRDYVKTSQNHAHEAVQQLTGMLAFFFRRYWSRRWIVQELAFAESSEYYLGSCRIESLVCDDAWVANLTKVMQANFEAVEELDGFCWPQELIRFFHNWPSRSWSLDFAPALLSFWRLSVCLQQLRQYDGVMDVTVTMSYCNRLDCGDARDRLFAVASLSRQRIAPNYNLSVPQTCIDFTRMLLENGLICGWMWSLRHNLVASAEEAELPSWVVDYRKDVAGDSRDPFMWFSYTISSSSVLTCEIMFWAMIKEVKVALEEIRLLVTYEAFDQDSGHSHVVNRALQSRNPDMALRDLNSLCLGDFICFAISSEICEGEFDVIQDHAMVLRPIRHEDGFYQVITILLAFEWTFGEVSDDTIVVDGVKSGMASNDKFTPLKKGRLPTYKVTVHIR